MRTLMIILKRIVSAWQWLTVPPPPPDGWQSIGTWFLGVASKNTFTDDPSYYSGIGPDETRLGPQQLRDIHQELIKRMGPNIAQQFVRMVEDLDDLSPTNFILQWRHFCTNEGRYEGKLPETRVYDRAPSASRSFDSATCTFAALLGDRRTPAERAAASEEIKRGFLDLIGHSQAA